MIETRNQSYQWYPIAPTSLNQSFANPMSNLHCVEAVKPNPNNTKLLTYEVNLVFVVVAFAVIRLKPRTLIRSTNNANVGFSIHTTLNSLHPYIVCRCRAKVLANYIQRLSYYFIPSVQGFMHVFIAVKAKERSKHSLGPQWRGLGWLTSTLTFTTLSSQFSILRMIYKRCYA